MSVGGCCGFVVILCLLFISGLLPVFSCVLIDKWLIINGIPICRLYAFAGRCCGDCGLCFFVEWLVFCGHIGSYRVCF
jgi:hypothetical protein